MLINTLSPQVQTEYRTLLASSGMFSGLFSENSTPYINSRVAEKAFCRATGATDRGRDDTSADATLDKVGIGIKTFMNGNGNTLQKVAEFDSDAYSFRDDLPEAKIRKVADLRNARIDATIRMYGLDRMIYHCVVRSKGKIMVYELPMDPIDINNIKDVKTRKNDSAITFNDGRHEYSFNVNKSTLYMRFETKNVLYDIPVTIIDDPFALLCTLSSGLDDKVQLNSIASQLSPLNYSNDNMESVILPLFSDRGGRNVPERSGLNQWNAGGRSRDENEVYIPIPSWIHTKFPGFFPNRNTPFTLILPDENQLSVKICQQGDKALMSNPNSALGKWLLRDLLQIPEGTLLTYSDLERLNIDSVEIYKETSDTYRIAFRPVGSFDDFAEVNSLE